ncbi:SDR family oxidoreductase [Nocardioides sp. DS6]|uniref:SDR family oxidoreductase n=1 Tax=Nocardioides eburneus TaxID=3231482 RepID=A0ABV3T2I2_9ACTN
MVTSPLTAGSGVVVTGAARGIGKGLAAKLTAEGCRVVVADVDATELQRTAAELGAHPVASDLSTQAGVAALVQAAEDHLGAIDAWYANAGIDRGRGLDASEDDWAASYDVNVLAHVRTARLLVPRWLARAEQEEHGGRFVVTASAAGLLTMVGAPAYSVTKHAAVAFAEWLSVTYRHRGVVVQAICPQGVRTSMLKRSQGLQDLLSHDEALTPAQVADVVWEAAQDDRFLILPHPQVADYYAGRAADPDRWLAGMNRIQRRLEEQGVLS